MSSQGSTTSSQALKEMLFREEFEDEVRAAQDNYMRYEAALACDEVLPPVTVVAVGGTAGGLHPRVLESVARAVAADGAGPTPMEMECATGVAPEDSDDSFEGGELL